jgi:hypothetical protein
LLSDKVRALFVKRYKQEEVTALRGELYAFYQEVRKHIEQLDESALYNRSDLQQIKVRAHELLRLFDTFIVKHISGLELELQQFDEEVKRLFCPSTELDLPTLKGLCDRMEKFKDRFLKMSDSPLLKPSRAKISLDQAKIDLAESSLKRLVKRNMQIREIIDSGEESTSTASLEEALRSYSTSPTLSSILETTDESAE